MTITRLKQTSLPVEGSCYCGFCLLLRHVAIDAYIKIFKGFSSVHGLGFRVIYLVTNFKWFIRLNMSWISLKQKYILYLENSLTLLLICRQLQLSLSGEENLSTMLKENYLKVHGRKLKGFLWFKTQDQRRYLHLYYSVSII